MSSKYKEQVPFLLEEQSPLNASQKVYSYELKGNAVYGSDKIVQQEKLTLMERFKKWRERPLVERTIQCFHEDGEQGPFSENVIRNQKYSKWNFFFIALIKQFTSFINFFYLLLALSQLVPALSVGFLFSYFAPLVFVVTITMCKEGYDDFQRYRRDKEVNNQVYRRLTQKGYEKILARDIKVGHIIKIETNQRVPADLVLIRTTGEDGSSFIRTDMLDGETDWKLRRPLKPIQSLASDKEIFSVKGELYAEAPKKDIYDFIGTFTLLGNGKEQVYPLTLENTMWMNTVVASGTVIGAIVYTGKDTRSIMNTAQPASKKGTTDREINIAAMILGGLLIFLAFVMVTANLYQGKVPISMSVNIDMAKLVYTVQMMNDPKAHGCIVRNTSIPEELGRISYLLSDKTGTLTQNIMTFKKLHLGQVSYSSDGLEALKEELRSTYVPDDEQKRMLVKSNTVKLQKKLSYRLKDAVTALALCHNVTPVTSDTGEHDYQASSPDEVALVKFTESAGVTLIRRTFDSITIRTPLDTEAVYQVLNIFPFTSTKKRMGIIVKEVATGRITFFMKGADVIMEKIVQYTDWMEEECNNLAREGYRTLAFGKKIMSQEEYDAFDAQYKEAEASIVNRDQQLLQMQESIEEGLELLGITGVEDKLQKHVRPTLEDLRNAGIKIWMLTGDKIETATCVGVSSKLIARSHEIVQMVVDNVTDARRRLKEFKQRQYNAVLVIDGKSLEICLEDSKENFFKSTAEAPAVICCRCSPTQKAEVVRLIKLFSHKQTAAVGDGGNDVSMIQEADVGIGIEGKEGKQASMAADFSVLQFSHIRRLLLWHGRNSYQRTTLIAQLIIHRGTIMTFLQMVFSLIFYCSSVAVFGTMQMMGYSVWYTSMPIFILVLDVSLPEQSVFLYPELYEELRKGRSFSIKTLCFWFFQSLYQGAILIIPPLFLFTEPYTYKEFSALVFTSLIYCQLINAMFEVHSPFILFVLAEVLSFAIYWWTLGLFRGSFDINYVSSASFWWQSCMLTAVACVPVLVVMLIYKRVRPPIHKKIAEN